MEYKGESPKNFQQKCLCVLLLDVSGSMRKGLEGNDSIRRIDKLNEGIARFYDDIINAKSGVAKTTKNQLEIAIIKFDQEPIIIRKPGLLESTDVPPILEERGSTTETVKAIEAVLDLVSERKRFYNDTGQKFYRPMIVLITDGKPSSPQRKIDMMGEEITRRVKQKEIYMVGLSLIGNINHETMSKLSGGQYKFAVNEFEFSKFFQWLSVSVSNLSKSSDDSDIDFDDIEDSWKDNIPD